MRIFHLPSILGALVLVACNGERGADNGGDSDAPSTESSAPGKGAEPEASAAAANGWNTKEWAIPRGGLSLRGRVHDPVIRNPQIEWDVELDGAVIADAAIEGDTIYVGSIMGTFYALDLANGEERWKFTTDDSIEAPPTVIDDKVFIGSNDLFFYCLEKETGKELWKYEGSDKFISGALVVKSPDGAEDWVVVNGYDGICRCLRVEDGSEVWTFQTDDQINSTPTIIDNKTIVFGGCDMRVHAINLADGTKVNEVEVDAEIVGTLATMGTMTYSANYANQLVAADAFGEKPTWIYEDKDFPFFASPALNDDYVFIGSRDKHLHAVKRETGEGAWTFKTGARVDGAAIVFDDAVVFGSGDGRLYALAPEDGQEIWRLDLGEGMSVSPAFARGRIVLGGTDGHVFCITGDKLEL